MMTNSKLPPPARYTPWRKGVYEVAPSLRPLGADFGNGIQDEVLIQVDQEFHRYRANKEAAYADDPKKYFGLQRLESPVALAVADAIASRLASDYPTHYAYGERSLTCHLTGKTVAWTATAALDIANSRLGLPAGHMLEAIAMQIQPDLAVVVRDSDGSDRIAAVHVCAPSQWNPVDKLGRSFFATHDVVPGFERVNAAAPRMVDAMIRQGPFVRFVWGVESDDRLNHHPSPPPGWPTDEWRGRRFDLHPFRVRVERQTLLGLPSVDAALFIIHPRTLPAEEILASPSERTGLLTAIRSMSAHAQRYKGVDRHYDALIAQLETDDPSAATHAR